MLADPMPKCPDAILRLVERFQKQSDQVLSPDYNETQLRIDFVNPMFAELGWDMANAAGYAEQYREVVHEDRVKVAGQTKAPDYSFRIGGHRKFFLEAKKPAVNIRGNWEPAYQLRRYAWSAKLACSVLTDFEEFAVYDSRIQPKLFDKASIARREFISYTDYESKWDFISGTFSKDAVLRGEFDRYCEAKKGRGAESFDDVFLNEIEEWRKALASNLALRNEALDEASLNFSVQRIIDRIIFLRIAEDRGTEATDQLKELLEADQIYPRLNWFFKTFLKSSKRTFSEIQARQVAQLPFPKALADSATTSAEIAKHVDSMLALQKRLASEQLSQREEQLRREIEATDIDLGVK